MLSLYAATCTTPDVTADKDLIASAQAFTKTSARYFIVVQCSHLHITNCKMIVLFEYLSKYFRCSNAFMIH